MLRKVTVARQTAETFLGLTALRAVIVLFPLVTFPYLVRVLGSVGYGKLAAAMSFGQVLTIVLEFGTSFSATREVSRARTDRESVSEIVAGVLGVQALLSLIAIALAAVVVTVQSTDPTVPSPDARWKRPLGGCAGNFSVVALSRPGQGAGPRPD